MANTSLLARIWRKIARGKATSESPVKLAPLKRDGATPKQPRARRSSIEPLEGRIAPAALLPGGKGISYTDVDGDFVKVIFSKPIFAHLGDATDMLVSNVFTFSTANATPGISGASQLQAIDLTPLIGKVALNGVSISITSDRQPTSIFTGGDGHVNIGEIDATGIALNKVTIEGDLGRILCGSNTSAVGLKSLSVLSLGVKTDTQGGASPTYDSQILGTLSSFSADTVVGAYLYVSKGTAPNSSAIGKVGSISITHSLSARTLDSDIPVGTPVTTEGQIFVDGGIGTVKIGSGLAGDGIIGGLNANNALVYTPGNIKTVIIKGDIIGGKGALSGSVIAGQTISKVSITGDLIGGAGSTSGSVRAQAIASVTIGHDLKGGDGSDSGSVLGSALLGSVSVKHSVTGGAGLGSGEIKSLAGSITSVTIGSASDSSAQGLFGGSGESSGVIFSGTKMGKVQIHGDIVGGAKSAGGVFSGGNLKQISVTGSVTGGTGFGSGFIQGYESVKSIMIGEDLSGGAAEGSGSTGENRGIVQFGGGIGSLVIKGSLIGGSTSFSGSVYGGFTGEGDLTSFSVGKGLIGGAGANSGTIVSGGTIIKGVVKAPLPDAPVALHGGAGAFSGSIFSYDGIRSLVLNGSVEGGSGADSGSIEAIGSVAKFVIKGDVTGSSGARSGSVISYENLGSEVAGYIGSGTVSGSVSGAVGASSGSIRSDGGIGKLKMGALLSEASILSGTGLGKIGDVGSISTGDIGSDISGATIAVHGSIKSLSAHQIHGSDIGATGAIGTFSVKGNISDTRVTAGSAPGDVTEVFRLISIGGSVLDHSQILAGYDLVGLPVNPNVEIGSVKVGGDWIASDLVAGVKDGSPATGFGTADDVQIAHNTVISKIARVQIGGSIAGTSETPDDHFGFVAQQIGSFKVGKTTIQPGAVGTPVAVNPAVDDVSILLVAQV